MDHSWGQFDTGLTVENRPNSGASAEARDQNLAFYFNGQLDTGSQVQTEFTLGDNSKPFLEGMIVINTQDKTARNLSTQAVVGNYPRTRGRLEYVPSLGSKGILVQIGGNRKEVHNYDNQYVGDLVRCHTAEELVHPLNRTGPDGLDRRFRYRFILRQQHARRHVVQAESDW